MVAKNEERDKDGPPEAEPSAAESGRDTGREEPEIGPFDDEHLLDRLELVNEYYSKNQPGETGSTRKVLGPLARFKKRLVKRLISWYVDPALENQLLFNAYITQTANEIGQYLEHLQHIDAFIANKTGEVNQKLEDLRQWVDESIPELEEEQHDLQVDLNQLQFLLTKEMNLIPTPPRKLQERVVGIHSPDFYMSGYDMYDEFNSMLAKVGKELRDFNDILDFGCGCGRTLRALGRMLPSVNLHGTDIDPEAIAWLNENYSSIADFVVNSYYPPMPFEDDSIDFLYSVSVFTHLPEKMQFAWLEDMSRVVRPGGYLINTIRARNQFEMIDEEERAIVRELGFYYTEMDSTDGLPEFYRTAFQSHEYIEKEWGRYFEVISVKPYGVGHNQDAVLLENRK